MAMLVEKCKGYKIRITSLLLGNIFLKSFEQSRYRFLEAKNATLCQPRPLRMPLYSGTRNWVSSSDPRSTKCFS